MKRAEQCRRCNEFNPPILINEYGRMCALCKGDLRQIEKSYPLKRKERDKVWKNWKMNCKIKK